MIKRDLNAKALLGIIKGKRGDLEHLSLALEDFNEECNCAIGLPGSRLGKPDLLAALKRIEKTERTLAREIITVGKQDWFDNYF